MFIDERHSMKQAIVAMILLMLGIAVAAAQSCDELWYQRNMIYKEAGYCFKTAKAIRSFGNAGCKYDEQVEVPLSARDRAEIATISGMERSMRCAP